MLRPTGVSLWLIGAGLLARGALADDTSARLYELTSETSMPHLEENLRGTRMRELRCLRPAELHAAFPVLAHESLRGCALESVGREEGEFVVHRLICAGAQGTTGIAQWQFGAGQSVGSLDVRLGGKNMTFSQHVTAKPMGSCGDPPR